METHTLIESTDAKESYNDNKSLESKKDTTKGTKMQATSEEVILKIAVCLTCVLSVLCVSAGVAAVQVLGGAIPVFQLNACRFGAQFVIMIPVISYGKLNIGVPLSKI